MMSYRMFSSFLLYCDSLYYVKLMCYFYWVLYGIFMSLNLILTLGSVRRVTSVIREDECCPSGGECKTPKMI